MVALLGSSKLGLSPQPQCVSPFLEKKPCVNILKDSISLQNAAELTLDLIS